MYVIVSRPFVISLGGHRPESGDYREWEIKLDDSVQKNRNYPRVLPDQDDETEDL